MLQPHGFNLSLVKLLACYISVNVKHYFFRRILISRFSYVENSLHFNLIDFPVNFIKQFVSCFFWCLYQILL